MLELPLPWALSSAEGFAFGAVSLLDRLECVSHISFGSECGDASALGNIADALLSDGFDERLRLELSSGISFALARQRAAASLAGEGAKLLREPNNILGVEYAKAILRSGVEYIKAITRLGSGIIPVTFKREGAGHDSAAELETASASRLRELLKSGGDVSKYIPEKALEVFREEIRAGRAPVYAENAETAMLSRLRQMTKTELSALDTGAEGLGERLYKNLGEPTLAQLFEKTKTKRYALSRIRRLVLRAYLGVPSALPAEPPYARVLAVGERGRAVLRRLPKDITVITKPAAAQKLTGGEGRVFALESAATDQYVLAFPEKAERRCGREYILGPAIV